MGEQVETLKHHPDLLANPLVPNPVAVHLYSIDEHLPRVRFDEEIDAAEQSALSRAAGADDDDGFALLDLERDSSKDVESAEVFLDVADADQSEIPSSPGVWNFRSRSRSPLVTLDVRTR